MSLGGRGSCVRSSRGERSPNRQSFPTGGSGLEGRDRQKTVQRNDGKESVDCQTVGDGSSKLREQFGEWVDIFIFCV